MLMLAESNQTPSDPSVSHDAGDCIEAELETLMRLLDGASAPMTGAAMSSVDLVRETAAEAAPRERYRQMGPTLARVAAVGIATLPAVLTPAPAFAGTPLPPNLMLAMATRPAAPPSRDVPPALAATGPQFFPFTRPMQVVRAQAVQPLAGAATTAEAPTFSLNPRLRSIFSEQRKVSITTKRQVASSLYMVQKGDSLYSIASDVLGSGPRWREIYDSNKDKVGAGFLLMPGQRLAIATKRPSAPVTTLAKAKAPVTTAVAVTTTTAASVVPAATSQAKPYVVAPGDNLYTIAEKQLGNPTRWREIVMLNKATLNGKTVIYPNQWLVLPTSQV